MKLCTARGISNLPPPLYSEHFSPSHLQFQSLLRRTNQFALLRFNSASTGLQYRCNSSLRSTTSEEISTDTSDTVDDTQLVEKKDDYGSQLNEAETPQEGSLIGNLLQPPKFLEDLNVKVFKFLEDLNIKVFKFLEDLNVKFQFDYEETYSILVFGGGGAVVLWLMAAVVGAIDSIPLLPKVLELIGLGYTLWFSSRYLILKKNRDELVSRVEQIKQQILGSEDD